MFLYCLFAVSLISLIGTVKWFEFESELNDKNRIAYANSCDTAHPFARNDYIYFLTLNLAHKQFKITYVSLSALCR